MTLCRAEFSFLNERVLEIHIKFHHSEPNSCFCTVDVSLHSFRLFWREIEIERLGYFIIWQQSLVAHNFLDFLSHVGIFGVNFIQENRFIDGQLKHLV